MLGLSETDLRPGCLEIRVVGELDLAEAPQLEQALKRVSEYEQIVISLEDCEFIDSTGIAVIVRAHQERNSDGRGLAVCGVVGQIRRVFEVTGLLEHGLVFDTAEGACAALEGAS
jgi:anti-anti-sigma factor